MIIDVANSLSIFFLAFPRLLGKFVMVLIISLQDIFEKKDFEGFFVQFLISAFSYSSHSIQHRKWCEVKLRLCVKNFMRIIQLYLLNDAEDIGTGYLIF